MSYWKNLKEKIRDYDRIKFQQLKYRCEQTIITKMNNIPTCTTHLKSDYWVEEIKDTENPTMNIYCKLEDHVSSIYPNQYGEALKMVTDLEKIKCESVIGIDMDTGKMNRIVNHKEVIEKWNNYKEDFQKQYRFIRSTETGETITKFLDSVDKVLTNDKMLLTELGSKMFFMLLCDGYLVGKEEYNNSYQINFMSQLFQGVQFPMTITPKIQKEAPDCVLLERNSSIDTSVKKMDQIKQMYDERFKPTIQYKFSEYDARFHTKMMINETEQTLLQAESYIIEEIPNNVSLTILCKLRKLD